MADLPRWHHERPWSQLELDDIRRNWAEHPERFSYAAGRWLATLAALPVATAGPEPGEAALRYWAVHHDLCGYRLRGTGRQAEVVLPREWLGPDCTCGLAAALRGAAAQADGGEPADGVDAVYAERNRLVAALAHLFSNAAWRGLDPSAPDFTVVYIDLPSGQVSWHIPDAEMGAFPALALREPTGWDGHDTDEKYRRLAALRRGDICRDVADAVIAAVNKERAAQTTYDPGRLILSKNLAAGLAIIREMYPKATDDFIAGWLSGYLGSYVVAVETAAARLVAP